MTRSCLPCLFLVLLAGCMEGEKPTPLQRGGSPAAGGRPKSLYDRLGGEPGITKVVDDFVANVVTDPKIKEPHKKHFREGDVAGLKRKLIEQVGEATGGPQKYTGKSMKEAHRGLGITNADFDALVADLVQALDNNQVGKGEQTELLNILGGLRKEVVEAPE
jgi:hemoglobin